MPIFEDALALMIATMQAQAAIDIVYRRGEKGTVLERKAWIGRTMFRVHDQGNSRVIWSDRDFLIPVADLTIDGVQVTPEEGDWIIQNFSGQPDAAGTNQRFEMMAPEGEPTWRYSDPQRMIYRIHTKRVKHS